jgi:hypothetical protein
LGIDGPDGARVGAVFDGSAGSASDEDRYRILSELRADARGGDVDLSVERRAGDFQRFGDLSRGLATG